MRAIGRIVAALVVVGTVGCAPMADDPDAGRPPCPCEPGWACCEDGPNSGCADPMTDNGFCGVDEACGGGVACILDTRCVDGACVTL